MRNLQAIVANYFVCYILGSLLVKGHPVNTSVIYTDWFPYAVVVSILFIVFFNVTAFAIQKIGLIITSIAQKLSLIFPVIMGLYLFNEPLTILKATAILLAVISIILINIPDRSPVREIKLLRHLWFLPLLVMLGNGAIELTLFHVQEKGFVENAQLNFVTNAFFMAGVWGLIYMLLKREPFFNSRELLAGVCLGIPNYFTIFLLIKALDIGWDGSVLFPVNNVGTLALVTLVGLIFFKEKLNKLNLAGLIMAVLAVWLISS